MKKLRKIGLAVILLTGMMSTGVYANTQSDRDAMRTDMQATGENLYNEINLSMAAEEQAAEQTAEQMEALIADEDAIDVTSLGLVGNGNAQSTIALYALSMALSSGKPLFFPDGEYNLAGYPDKVPSMPYHDLIDNDLTIIGESRTNTIIINFPPITVKGNLRIENISLSADIDVVFWLKPTAFQTLYVNNTNFSGDSTKTRFFYAEMGNMTIAGLARVDITNCEVSNCKDFAVLRCHIQSGLIEKNIVENLGMAETELTVFGFLLGYQNDCNITTAPASNLLIKKNYLKDFYNNGSGEESDRMSGMLIYGEDVTVEGNYLENIIAGQLSSGIYVKGPGTIILNNTLWNAGDGQGSIVHKYVLPSTNEKALITGNRIMSDIYTQKGDTLPHAGILVESSRFSIADNYVDMDHGIGINCSITRDKTNWEQFKLSCYEILVDDIPIVEAAVTGNEVISTGPNALHIGGIDGEVTITGNDFTCEPDTPSQGVVTIKQFTGESEINLSGNTIKSVGTHAFFVFSGLATDNVMVNIENNTIATTTYIGYFFKTDGSERKVVLAQFDSNGNVIFDFVANPEYTVRFTNNIFNQLI